VAVGSHGPKNAALLAGEILALSDASLEKKLLAYRRELNDAPTTV
jgi:phosphoribosylcarboxyaminoimidazole (NCAIR) mutase